MKTENTRDLKQEEGKNHKMSLKQKYDHAWNIFFSICFAASIIGTYYLFKDVGKFREKLISMNRDYAFPMLKDFKICIIFTAIIIFSRLTIEHKLQDFTIRIMKDSLRNPKTEEDRELRGIYRKKLATHIFKGFMYTLMTIWGYKVLGKLDYFPKSLFGNGWMPNMFLKGFPNAFFHEKPAGFDTYYFFCFSYFLSDAIWLIFINEKQSDFFNMLLHHVCTISLISFSYLTNYSNIGSLVLLVHVITDIFVHLTRLLLKTDCPEIFKNISGIFLVFNFIYVRIYVFGDIIYTIYKYITWEWGSITWFLFLFLTFLYMMHVNWTLMLLQKFYVLLKGTKITDTRSYKAEEKLQEKQEEQKLKEIKKKEN